MKQPFSPDTESLGSHVVLLQFCVGRDHPEGTEEEDQQVLAVLWQAGHQPVHCLPPATLQHRTWHYDLVTFQLHNITTRHNSRQSSRATLLETEVLFLHLLFFIWQVNQVEQLSLVLRPKYTARNLPQELLHHAGDRVEGVVLYVHQPSLQYSFSTLIDL